MVDFAGTGGTGAGFGLVAHPASIATHVAESADESDLVTRGEGSFAGFLRGRSISVAPRARSPVALLAACGVLAPGTLLVHCVHTDAADIADIARHRCGVATCPMSNRYFLHGAAPVQELLAAGVALGVGSDSMARSAPWGSWTRPSRSQWARSMAPHTGSPRWVCWKRTWGHAGTNC